MARKEPLSCGYRPYMKSETKRHQQAYNFTLEADSVRKLATALGTATVRLILRQFSED
jgi:hypothetical protein